eukprot:351308-Chlamydomonas_euryale.AAC.4
MQRNCTVRAAHMQGGCSARAWSMQPMCRVDAAHAQGPCSARAWSMQRMRTVHAAHVQGRFSACAWSMQCVMHARAIDRYEFGFSTLLDSSRKTSHVAAGPIALHDRRRLGIHLAKFFFCSHASIHRCRYALLPRGLGTATLPWRFLSAHEPSDRHACVHDGMCHYAPLGRPHPARNAQHAVFGVLRSAQHAAFDARAVLSMWHLALCSLTRLQVAAMGHDACAVRISDPSPGAPV